MPHADLRGALPRSPLAQVIAQVKFPPILAIHGPETVAGFQEALRETYPHLGRHQVHTIDLTGGPTPNVNQGVVWRLADREAGSAVAGVSRGGFRVSRDPPL